jgi:hypothetical protein
MAFLYDPSKDRIDSLLGWAKDGKVGWLSGPSRYTWNYAMTFPTRELVLRYVVGGIKGRWQRWFYPGRYLLLISDGVRQFIYGNETGKLERII